MRAGGAVSFYIPRERRENLAGRDQIDSILERLVG
jgi:hypothetical protein